MSGIAWQNPCPSPVEEEMSSPGFRRIQESKDMRLSRGSTTGTLSSTESTSCCSDMEDSSSPDILGRPTGTDTASTARTDWHISSSRDSTNTIAPMSRRRSSSSSISFVSDGDELGNCSSEGGTNPTARSSMESTTASTTQAMGRAGPPAPQGARGAAASPPPGYSSSSSDDFSLFVGEHDRPRRSKGKGKERRQGERALPASRRSTLPLSLPRRNDRDDQRQGVRTAESDTAGKVLRQPRLAWARISGPTLRSSLPSSSTFRSSSSPIASSLSTAEEEAEMLVSSSLVDLSTASPGTAETEPVREVIDIVDDGPPLLPVPPSSRKREREKTGERRGGGGGGISGRSGSEDEPVIETCSPCDGEDGVSFDAPANTGRGRTARASGFGRTRARRSGAAGQSSRGSSHEPTLEGSEDESTTIESSRRQRRRLPNGVQSLVTSRTDGSTRSGGNGGGRVGSRTVSENIARGASAARQRRQTNRRTDRLAARLQRDETVRQEERDAEMARRLQSEEEINLADWGEGNFPGVVAAVAAARAATAAAAVAAAASSGQHVRRGPNRSEGGSIARGSFRLNGSRIVPSAIPRLANGSGSGGRGAVEWDVAAIMNLVSETLSEFSGGGSSSNMSLMNRDLTPADYQELLSLDEHHSSFNRAKGLSAVEMSMLPQQTGNGSGPVEQCCICMEDMTSRQKITRLPACLHTFHSKCISQWLKGQPTCPIDKVVVSVREE